MEERLRLHKKKDLSARSSFYSSFARDGNIKKRLPSKDVINGFYNHDIFGSQGSDGMM